jgi:hypothetical protein
MIGVMAARSTIGCRVTTEKKERLRALAHRHQLTESALLMQLIDVALLHDGGVPTDKPTHYDRIPRGARLYVRLRPDDHLMLRERGVARRMPAGTYAATVLAAHLHAQAPLPIEELRALMESVSHLGAIHRYLRHLVHSIRDGGDPAGPRRSDLVALLNACAALRDHIKALIKTNQASWESGRAQSPR